MSKFLIFSKLNLLFNTFLEIPDREVSYISEEFQIDLDKGIALNKSLKENLFTSFVCIVNRIPLIANIDCFFNPLNNNWRKWKRECINI